MKTIERHRYKDNRVYQTRQLTFEPFRYSENNMSLVMGLIRKNLTPDLLSTRYREENVKNPMFGHCYHSSQALYYLMNTDFLIPMSGKDYRGDYHWWLQDEDKIYDITSEQYYSLGKLPPYENGTESRWYGWKQRPHQRSLDLMVRVLGKENVKDEILTF